MIVGNLNWVTNYVIVVCSYFSHAFVRSQCIVAEMKLFQLVGSADYGMESHRKDSSYLMFKKCKDLDF